MMMVVIKNPTTAVLHLPPPPRDASDVYTKLFRKFEDVRVNHLRCVHRSGGRDETFMCTFLNVE